MNNSWFRNKILGDFAESVCESHFKALDYNVEYTGIEKFAQLFTQHNNNSTRQSDSSKLIYQSVRKTPDLLISRLNENKIESFMVEVKYLKQVPDMKLYENELLWKYRKVIWNQNTIDLAKLNINEKTLWEDDSQVNLNIINKLKKVVFNNKNNLDSVINLPIIFYLVVKNPKKSEEHIYCNYTTFPGWWNLGDNRYDKYSHYLPLKNSSLNQTFNQIYFNEVKPALEDVFL